jgi:hypothetical protein
MLAAAFAVSVASWRAIPGLRGSTPRAPSAAESLAAFLRHHPSARAIGAAYLAATPSESRVEPLVEALAASLEAGSAPLPLAHRPLRARLLLRMQRDFEENATVCLEGWILSRTEARLCGLAALL